jgi:hypothetical protein
MTPTPVETPPDKGVLERMLAPIADVRRGEAPVDAKAVAPASVA